MQRQRISPNESSLADDDRQSQSVVLMHLAEVWPAPLTVDELQRELASTANDFVEHDDIQRATRDLVNSGLVHRRDDVIWPSRSAIKTMELLDAFV